MRPAATPGGAFQLMRPLHHLIAATLLLAAPAAAQEFGEERVAVEAKFAPASVAAGASVELVVRVTPADGWHVYGSKETLGTPTMLTVTAAGGLTPVGSATVPDGLRHQSGAIVSYWLDAPFTIVQRFNVPATVAAGTVTVAFELGYMACTPELCDPPATATGTATLQVTGAPPGGEPQQAAAAPQAGGQTATFADQRIRVAARFEPPQVQANGKTTLVLEVTPAEGWHVYGSKNEIGDPIGIAEIEGKGVVRDGNARVPEGVPHAVGTDTTYWLGEPFEIRQDLRVERGTAPGKVDVRVKLRYIACTEQTCDAPAALAGNVELVVAPGEASPPADGGGSDSAGLDVAQAPDSLLAFLLAAIGWGLFALAMPCTYPMIPITISFFTKQAEARSGSALALALVYGLGIVLMFIVIGAVVGVPIQSFATHPVTNLVFGAVFLVFALALFGMFTLEPPRWAMNLAGQAAGRGGYGGVFLMGATLVVTSFTCTAPFVGSLLGASARYGLGRIVLGMGVFGLTMAVPFVLLSLLPGKARALPRGGEWMNTIKVFLGFVEVAAALKFISNADLVWQWRALSRELFLWLWVAIFGLGGMYLLGQIRLKGEDGGIGPGRLVSGLATILFAAYCLFGALGGPLDRVMTGIVPNYSASVAGTEGKTAALAPKHTIVADDHQRAVALAAASGKLVLINFTGFT